MRIVMKALHRLRLNCVCVYVCVCVRACVRARVRAHVCVFAFEHACVRVNMRECVCAFVLCVCVACYIFAGASNSQK